MRPARPRPARPGAIPPGPGGGGRLGPGPSRPMAGPHSSDRTGHPLGTDGAEKRKRHRFPRDDFILAIVEFPDGDSHRVHDIRRPFRREPDFGAASVNDDLSERLARAEEPR